MTTALDLLKHPIAMAIPRRLTRFSFWVEHIPFGMFLVDLLKPRVLVELGTQHGDSYCAFCQAVQTLELPTQCFAVDTWQGDQHVGTYGGEVLEELRAHHDPLYGNFSSLIESTFDDAAGRFQAASIDLLHIDGTHTYEAVKHDFECWIPKMSSRGIILLHDTAVREHDFGVWRLWDEVSGQYPHLNFLYGCGLGVLAVGREQPSATAQFFEACSVSSEADAVRHFFSRLGSSLSLRIEIEELADRRADDQVQADRDQQELRGVIASQSSVNEELQSVLTLVRQQVPAAAAMIDDQELVAAVGHCLQVQVPPGATVAVIDGGDDRLLSLTGCWPFPRQRNGASTNCRPVDEMEAVIHLESVRTAGADFLLAPRTAYWWFQRYPYFQQHLQRRYSLAHGNDQLTLYDLRQPTFAGLPLGLENSLTGARALIIIPGSVNYFYDRAGSRVADALSTLGCTVEIGDLQTAAPDDYDWCLFVNPYEIAFSAGGGFHAVERMRGIQAACGESVALLMECARTEWFSKSLEICRKAGLRRLLDLGFRSQQRDVPADARGEYQFGFNGLTQAESLLAQDAAATRRERPIPWVFVGHAAPLRLAMLERLLRQAEPGGLVYMPNIGPVSADGPHLNGAQLKTVLEHARCQVWCSHHEHFYLESERFRDSLMAGCLPVKVVRVLLEDPAFLPLPMCCIAEDEFAAAWPSLHSEKTWQRFVAEFTALPLLEETLYRALLKSDSLPRRQEVLHGI